MSFLAFFVILFYFMVEDAWNNQGIASSTKNSNFEFLIVIIYNII